MKLIKTDKGREALRSRDPHLAPRERQIMILANGSHSRVSLQQLLARDIGPQLHRLLASGYLEECAPGVADPHRSSAEPSTHDQVPRTRRSLAGTKMYILDRLQLLRDAQASSMAVCLHSNQGEGPFIQNVVQAVHLIVEKCGPSYGLRVLKTLLDTVPEVHVAVFHHLASDIETRALSSADPGGR